MSTAAIIQSMSDGGIWPKYTFFAARRDCQFGSQFLSLNTAAEVGELNA